MVMMVGEVVSVFVEEVAVSESLRVPKTNLLCGIQGELGNTFF